MIKGRSFILSKKGGKQNMSKIRTRAISKKEKEGWGGLFNSTLQRGSQKENYNAVKADRTSHVGKEKVIDKN